MPYDNERNREIEKFLFGLENIIVSTRYTSILTYLRTRNEITAGPVMYILPG